MSLPSLFYSLKTSRHSFQFLRLTDRRLCVFVDWNSIWCNWKRVWERVLMYKNYLRESTFHKKRIYHYFLKQSLVNHKTDVLLVLALILFLYLVKSGKILMYFKWWIIPNVQLARFNRALIYTVLSFYLCFRFSRAYIRRVRKYKTRKTLRNASWVRKKRIYM